MTRTKTLAIFILLLLTVFSGCSKETVKQAEPRSKVLYSYFDTVTLIYS